MKNMENKLIFLSKNEKTYGPFTQRDIEKLKSSGEWFTFHWIFYEGQKSWLPLESAPHEIPEIQKTSFENFGNIHVICHNFKEAFSGLLTNPSPLGAEIPSLLKEESPLFEKKDKVIVNIFSASLNQTASIKAQVDDCYKNSKQWHYLLQWNSCPHIFLKN